MPRSLNPILTLIVVGLIPFAAAILGMMNAPVRTGSLIVLLCSTLALWLVGRGLFLYTRRVKSAHRQSAVRPESPLLPYWSIGPLVAASIGMITPIAGALVLAVYLATSLIIIAQQRAARKALMQDSVDLAKELETEPYDVIVHTSGAANVAYQVHQWIPVLEKLPYKVAIVVRHYPLFLAINGGSVPVVYATRAETVSQVIRNGTKAILYPANYMHNTQLFRHTECAHIFINHGESDKIVNQSQFMMAYDHLFVGGQLAKDRLIESGLPIRDEQVVFVGRPQAEMELDRVRDASGVTNVLYAPTWEGFVEIANVSSIEKMGLEILRQLAANPSLKVKFKPHPLTGSRHAPTKKALDAIYAYCAEAGIEVLPDGSSLHDAMNWSDMLITDISSVLNEYLVTDKPIVICDPWTTPEDEFTAANPSSRAAYILQDATELKDMVDDIATNDPLREQRAKTRVYSLSDFPDGSFKTFVSELGDAIERKEKRISRS